MRLRSPLFAVALFAIAAGQAHATDARLLSREYNPGEVVLVEGKAGVQATIVFADDEHIENIAVGDSNSWQVTPNKRANLVFVKPLDPRARTNMTVVTDRRLYVFDLVAGSPSAPFYVLRFTYADEPKTAPRLAEAMTAEEAQAAASPPVEAAPPTEAAPAQPPTLNFAWRFKGSRRLLPTRIYDDGEATYLTWPAGGAIPAVLMRNEKGEEGAVNYAVRGDVLVLDSIPKVIVLRSGRDVATIENEAALAADAAASKLAALSEPAVVPPIRPREK